MSDPYDELDPDRFDRDGAEAGEEGTEEMEEDPGWPISFLILVGAGALYLILRFYQMFRNLLT